MKKSILLSVFMALVVCASASWATGTTKWYPVMYEEKPRTLEEFVKDMKKGRARLTQERFLEEIEAQTELHFETMDEFAQFFDPKNPETDIFDCDLALRDLPAGFGIARVNNAGTVVDYNYTRVGEGKPLCNAGEKILHYKGTPILSLWCGNPIQWPEEEVVAIPLVSTPPVAEFAVEEPKKEIAPIVPEEVCTREYTDTVEKTGTKFSHGHGGFFGGNALLAVPPADYATESTVTTRHWRLKCK